jgi:uncharacterized protein (TIGR04255 family)
MLDWKVSGKQAGYWRSQMFELGPVGQYTLARPPLAQALAQVRFPLLAKLQTFEGVAPLQEALLAEYPYMDKVTETGVSVTVGQASPLQPESTISWHFKDDDDRLLVVGPNVMTLSLSEQYEGFADFKIRFVNSLIALKASLAPSRCVQLGIRYFNLVDDVGEDENRWKRIFNESIVGWPASQIVHGDTRLQSSVSQIQLVSPPINELADFPEDIQAIIRHGIAPATSMIPGFPILRLDDRGFFLDIDIFVVGSQDFDVDEMSMQLDAMHSQVDRFFRWSLTPEGEKYFGLEEKR